MTTQELVTESLHDFDRLPNLTRRQMQFLSLKATGLTDKEVAARCYVSRQTVERTLEDARTRMGTNNVLHAVVRAIALEILILDHDGNVLVPEEFNALAA